MHAALIANSQQSSHNHKWHIPSSVFSFPKTGKLPGIAITNQRASNKYATFENDIRLHTGPGVTL